MVHDEFEIVTVDGLTLYGQSWLPDNEMSCILCVVHGLGDHSGRYVHFARFMNIQKYGVFTMDLRGHGRSEGKKGHTTNYGYLLSDVEQLLIETRLRYQEMPIILFGHSLGANIVANFILRHKSKEITGIILSAPWFALKSPPTRHLEFLTRTLSKIMPAMCITEGTDPVALSKDPEVGMDFLKDPLVHDKISLKMYVAASDAARWAVEHANLLSYPTLVQHGDEDPLTSWTASKKFAENAGKIAEFVLWNGLRHEPHNEVEKRDFFESQSVWIEKIIHS